MSIARAFTWPIRRLLDPRFRGIAEQADSQHLDLVQRFEVLHGQIAETMEHELAQMRNELTALRESLVDVARADTEATREANELLGRSLGDLLAEATATTIALEEISNAMGLRNLRDGSVEDLDARTAAFLNFASSHRGFAAQQGLWFNPPISLVYEVGGVRASDTNERIVELPYVFRGLAGTQPGAAILDVGAAESTLAFSLASIGFEVTALDLNPYPLSHPRLESVQGDILDWESDKTFDAVVCLSTLEHVGLAVYGAEAGAGVSSADARALERMRALTKPNGVLVLTVPFGASSGDATQRSYERDDLERLLDGWELDDLTIVRRQDELTWVPDEGARDADERRVALVTARRTWD